MNKLRTFVLVLVLLGFECFLHGMDDSKGAKGGKPPSSTEVFKIKRIRGLLNTMREAPPALAIEASIDLMKAIEPLYVMFAIHCEKMTGILDRYNEIAQETILRSFKKFDKDFLKGKRGKGIVRDTFLYLSRFGEGMQLPAEAHFQQLKLFQHILVNTKGLKAFIFDEGLLKMMHNLVDLAAIAKKYDHKVFKQAMDTGAWLTLRGMAEPVLFSSHENTKSTLKYLEKLFEMLEKIFIKKDKYKHADHVERCMANILEALSINLSMHPKTVTIRQNSLKSIINSIVRITENDNIGWRAQESAISCLEKILTRVDDEDFNDEDFDEPLLKLVKLLLKKVNHERKDYRKYSILAIGHIYSMMRKGVAYSKENEWVLLLTLKSLTKTINTEKPNFEDKYYSSVAIISIIRTLQVELFEDDEFRKTGIALFYGLNKYYQFGNFGVIGKNSLGNIGIAMTYLAFYLDVHDERNVDIIKILYKLIDLIKSQQKVEFMGPFEHKSRIAILDLMKDQIGKLLFGPGVIEKKEGKKNKGGSRKKRNSKGRAGKKQRKGVSLKDVPRSLIFGCPDCGEYGSKGHEH